MSRKREEGGYSKPSTNEQGRKLMDISGEKIDTQCAWNDHGARCYRYGTQSDATNGFGPWYCRKHHRELNGYPPGPEPESEADRFARRMNKFEDAAA